jgi:hypothetical protein
MSNAPFSIRCGLFAGTAVALIMAASVDAGATQQNSIAPAPRDYSTPGSMPKPSGLRPSDDGIRFRNSPPASREPEPPHHQTSTPLTPAAAAPAAHAAPSEAEPESRFEMKPVRAPAKASAPPAPIKTSAPPAAQPARPPEAAAPAPVAAPAPAARPAAAPAPVTRPAAAPSDFDTADARGRGAGRPCRAFHAGAGVGIAL